jgi:hypothetical protein
MRLLVALALSGSIVAQSAAPLRIVVIEGEGAVNIIQQKTAVRPLVEVRDRNNVPVPGASVTFSVNGQPAAFANGATTTTVTTNAQGQAAAAGFNAVRPGAVQIQVQAAHQGQVATAMISQTNFATAAAAAAAGVAAGAASGGAATTGAGAGAATTAGAAGGGAAGGGISATTIAIVGGAVAAGGVVAATQLGGSSSESAKTYSGDVPSTAMTANLVLNSGGVTQTCSQQRNVSGNLQLVYDPDRPKAMFSIQAPTVSSSSGNVCPAGGLNPTVANEAPLSGVPNTPSFNTTVNTSQAPNSAAYTISFAGTLSGGVITGTLTYTETNSGTYTGGGTVSIPVSLR